VLFRSCDGEYSYGTSSGKSGKGGSEGYDTSSGKSGKGSEGYGTSSGKSGKGGIYEQVCLTPEPIPPTPPSIDIPPVPTPPSPTPDPCEDPIIQAVTINGETVCSNGDFPTADGFGDMAFDSFNSCCSTLSAQNIIAADMACPIEAVCGTPTPAPVETPVETPAPVETPVETYEPTAPSSTGSTPTVATEAVSDVIDMGPRL